MQHLARVQKAESTEHTSLELLAREVSAWMWERIEPAYVVKTSDGIAYQEGALVLLTLDGDNQVVQVEDAVPAVLNWISQYLARGITPEFLAEEAERAEQWRQSLTLQSQEIGRRVLETAARRDEIQELEQNLKLEREELERREATLKIYAEELNQREATLKAYAEELDQREAQLRSQETDSSD